MKFDYLSTSLSQVNVVSKSCPCLSAPDMILIVNSPRLMVQFVIFWGTTFFQPGVWSGWVVWVCPGRDLWVFMSRCSPTQEKVPDNSKLIVLEVFFRGSLVWSKWCSIETKLFKHFYHWLSWLLCSHLERFHVHQQLMCDVCVSSVDPFAVVMRNILTQWGLNKMVHILQMILTHWPLGNFHLIFGRQFSS